MPIRRRRIKRAPYGKRTFAKSTGTRWYCFSACCRGVDSTRSCGCQWPHGHGIRVDGERIRLDKVRKRYIALHKPRHYITTMRDQFGRKTVVDLVPFAAAEHLVPVGRLDAESEGLLLLTNDGDLVNVLTHPRYQHEKEYVVEVYGHPDKDFFEAVKHGVVLEDGTRTLPAHVRVERKTDETTRYLGASGAQIEACAYRPDYAGESPTRGLA